MSEKEIETCNLIKDIVKTANIGKFIKRNSNILDTISFHTYINGKCTERNILPARVIEKSGIERTFGYQLFNGRRKPSRDKVIQIALGFGMDYTETQDLLQAARKCALYPIIKRDAVLIHALAHNLPLVDVQATLSELSLPLIGEEADHG